MVSRGAVSFDDWEVGIRNRLLAQKLASALFAKEVERFFIQNRLGFEQVILYQLVVANAKLAQELYYQIEEGEISFYDAAHFYDVDDNRRRRCGYEGQIERGIIPSDIASIIFSKPTRELVGPIKTEQGFHLFMVEDLLPPELTPQRYEEILNNMLQQWLLIEVNCLVPRSNGS